MKLLVPASPSAPPAPPAAPAGRRRLAFKAIALLLPLLGLALLEGGLRLAGYGPDLRLFVTDAQHPDYWVMNPAAARRYFTQAANAPVGNAELFRKHKAPGTFRVFVLGESTTIGYPYMHNAAFPRWLHYRLLRARPRLNLEIINLSLTAVSSYTVRGFAEELVNYAPDAVLVYAGHNEYYGAMGVGSTSRWAGRPGLVRWLLRAQDLRLVQALRRAWSARRGGVGNAKADERQTLMQRMAADQHIVYGSVAYVRGIQQFEENMSGLCQLLSGRHVPVLISTLVSNEKDLPPFISGAVPPAASAQAAYQRANLAYQQGDFEQARRQYAQARELDLLRFRAPAAMNQVIRGLPGRFPGVFLVDAERLFRQHSPHGILGQELLLEHVHPNLAGYALLSEAFYQALKSHRLLPPAAPGEAQEGQEMSLAQLRRQMPVTVVDSLKGAYEILTLKQGWPFHQSLPPSPKRNGSVEAKLAGALLAQQLAWNEAMEQLMNYYLRQNDARRALRVAEAVLLEYPYDPTFYFYAGKFSQQAGQPQLAALYLRKAFERQPSAQLAQQLFGLHLQLDQPAQAIPYLAYARARTTDPRRLDEVTAFLETLVSQKNQLATDSTNAPLLRAVADAYQQLGHPAVAARYARRAARTDAHQLPTPPHVANPR